MSGKEEEERIQVRSFNPNEHLMQIKSGQSSKDYLPVQWRLVWFRSAFPQGSIETEMVHLDLERDTEEEAYAWNAERRRSEKVTKHAKGFAVFKATVKDGQGGVGTGTKSEKAASFGDYIEKAETGAIGRALAALGYGTQFTGDEWDEAHRIVDSPIEQKEKPQNAQQITSPVEREANKESLISPEQINSIQKLSDYLKKVVSPNIAKMSFSDARTLIQELNAEYKAARSSQPVPETPQRAVVQNSVIVTRKGDSAKKEVPASAAESQEMNEHVNATVSYVNGELSSLARTQLLETFVEKSEVQTVKALYSLTAIDIEPTRKSVCLIPDEGMCALLSNMAKEKPSAEQIKLLNEYVEIHEKNVTKVRDLYPFLKDRARNALSMLDVALIIHDFYIIHFVEDIAGILDPKRENLKMGLKTDSAYDLVGPGQYKEKSPLIRYLQFFSNTYQADTDRKLFKNYPHLKTKYASFFAEWDVPKGKKR